MKKKIFCLLIALIASITLVSAQCFTLVRPNCSTYSLGIGYMFNNNVGDFNFNQDYVMYNFTVGKYFDKNIGLSGNFFLGNSDSKGANTRIYFIGLELNNRLTDYYVPESVDFGFNIGIGYGRFDYANNNFNSEGMNYVVPKVSFDIIFNLSGDKAYQFVLEPSYQYFVPLETKYYYDDGSKVNAGISLIGITGKLRVNF